MADFSAPIGAGAPATAMDYAQQVQSNDAQNNLRNIQGASAVNDLQAKQRSMQLSMLSGVLNEQDPEKQRQLLGNIVPIANKLNPSYQIDPNVDVGTVRALVQSQITPTEQATLANQRQLFGVRASTIQKDPLTGALIRVNKYTGESTPVTPQEAALDQASGGDLGGGIFPQPAARPGAPAAAAPIQPVFGFPLGSLANDPNSVKLGRANAAAFDKNRQGRDTAADAVLNNVAVLKNDLANVKGGSVIDRTGLQLGGIYGSKQARDAQDADSNAKELALNLTTLNQSATGGGSGRSTVVGLKTLLGSKPDPYNSYQENNLSNLNKIEGEVNRYKLETNFLDAYKEANPLHIIDNNAYDLFDALNKKYPIITTKNGAFTYNEDNANALKDAIPDALANPYNYMGKTSASSQAKAALKSPETPATNETSLRTKEDIGAAFQNGKITKEQATELLKSKYPEQFGD